MRRVVRCTFWKLTKMPWAVSGRRYTVFLASSVTPWKVLNIRLNWRMSVQLNLPQEGQTIWCSSMNSFIWVWLMASTLWPRSNLFSWHQFLVDL